MKTILFFVVFIASVLILFLTHNTVHSDQKQNTNTNILPSHTPTVFIQPTLTLNTLLDEITPNIPKTITVTATGDVMLGRTVNYKSTNYDDFTWAFTNINSLLKSADISLINLEGPLVENCPIRNDGMIFCGNTQHIDGLLESGIDIANIANNHGFDWGYEGLATTQSLLQTNNIDIIGLTSQPIYKKVDNTTFSFLSFNSVNPQAEPIEWATEKNIQDKVSVAEQNSDIVIVSFHWGNEYTHTVTNLQQTLAHFAIDKGADAVIGHHPHWIQGIEIYKGVPIFYSLGNTIFDQMWSQETREGLIATLYIENNKVVDSLLQPILIEDYGIPRLMDSQEKQTQTQLLRDISKFE